MRAPSLWIGLFLACAATARAQLELLDGRVWITAEGRARFEYRAQNATFNAATGAADDDGFLLTRVRLGAGAKPVDWFQIYGELQDSREFFSYRSPNREEDTTDWRQGWIALGDLEEFPLEFRIGRQLLVYGNERLIGAFDWNNVGRRFDSLKLRFRPADYPGWIDFFAANVVLNDDNHFDDRADWEDDFFGLYGHSERLAKHVVEMYALYRDKEDAANGGAKRQLYTIGARFATKPVMTPWDYWVEFAGQFGHVQTPGDQFGEASAAWADQIAYAGAIGLGYTFTDCVWTPRVGVEYNHASGDDNPTDGEVGTFDNLFPTNHKFYGFMDLVAWKNIHNPHLLFSVKPHPKVTVRLDGHLFWLAERRDAWYRASGAPIRRDATGAARRFVGSEVDLTVSYAPHQRVKLAAGYSHFFTGDFVKDTGAHSDADFVYLQVMLRL